ncbi:NAD-dependent epimerase/dehydratase family protein [Gramella sp. GC03-9]|uniref:NAD-dependent epimerase/dehydratase family protein n=1 Tax=Christiangramia oceanisediminis TaxID=2920386 RepID=A0A9X2I6T8_9FLAO|nr:NAD-dependent epimerase/dehydratase family protein [Gramella oceanisediminis]MCP9198744.1 NAD-dependent epimerase/dehydratase family protein [Gramella oceanisediminis]
MILVTGGTGLVGAHLLYELAQDQDRILATKRHSSNIQSVRKVFGYYSDPEKADRLFEKIKWVTASLTNIPSLTDAFERVEYVYHCAALISFDPSDERKLRKINIEGTANIVNLCIAKNVKKLCYVSSVAAIGANLNDEPVNESSKWNPEAHHNDYAISKYGAEIEVWRGTQEGVPTVIVNPGIIIGPGYWDSGSGKIFSRIDKGLKYHFPKVSGFVGVGDVVDAMLKLMHSNIKNEQFILVAENLSFEKVLKDTARLLDKPEPSKRLTKWMVSLGWIFQKIGSWFGMPRQITRESISSLFGETRYDNSKIRERLQFDFTPIDRVLEKTASIYKKEKQESNPL